MDVKRTAGDRIKTFENYDADIRDFTAVSLIFQKHGSDLVLVVHTAAQPSHDWAAREPFTDFSINATGTLNLLQTIRQFCPNASFIFTSTNKVYGDTPNRLPLRELSTRWEIDRAHPYYKNGINESMCIDQTKHSIFGASKVAADIMVQEYGRYFVLALITQRTLSTKDFTETRQGVCRLHTKLGAELAETLGSWQAQIAPVVESVMHQLVSSSPRMSDLTTPLTRTNHRLAWDARAPERKRRQSRTGTLTLPSTCRDCGSELPSRRHRYCEDCRNLRWQQNASRVVSAPTRCSPRFAPNIRTRDMEAVRPSSAAPRTRCTSLPSGNGPASGPIPRGLPLRSCRAFAKRPSASSSMRLGSPSTTVP